MKRIQDFKTFSSVYEASIFSKGMEMVKKAGAWLKKLVKAQTSGEIPIRDKKYNPETKQFDLPFEATPVVKVHMPDNGTRANFMRKDIAAFENVDEAAKSYEDQPWYLAQKSQDPEIDDVTTEELTKDLRYHFKNPESGRPLLIWGAPGIGKTSVVKNFGKNELGVPVIEVILSLMEPTDVAGLPGKKSDERYGDVERSVNFLPMIWPLDNGFKKVMNEDGEEIEVEGDGGIIFLDEINRAHPSVQAAMLKVVLDREIAGANYKIPSKWLILAAANRPEDEPGAMVKPMSFALANRFAQVNFINSPEAWTSYAKKKSLSDDVTAFVELMQEYFYVLPTTLVGGEDSEVQTTMGVTPRSWEAAAVEYQEKKDTAEAEGTELTEYEIGKIFSKHIGKSTSSVITDFLETIKVWPNGRIEKIYTDPKDPSLELPRSKTTGKPDFRKGYAIAYIASKYKRGQQLTKDEVKNLLEYLLIIDSGEIAISLFNMVKRTHPEIKDILGDTSLEPSLTPVITKYRGLLKEI